MLSVELRGFEPLASSMPSQSQLPATEPPDLSIYVRRSASHCDGVRSLAPELAPGARRTHQPWRLSVQLFGAGVEVIHGTFFGLRWINQKVGLKVFDRSGRHMSLGFCVTEAEAEPQR